jgi:hypothetical protein
MYQPKIQDRFIRKLYAVAKCQGVPMTVCLNDILEEYLGGEESILYEGGIIRRDVSMRTAQHEPRKTYRTQWRT